MEDDDDGLYDLDDNVGTIDTKWRVVPLPAQRGDSADMTAQLDLAERWRFFYQPGTVVTRHTAALEIPASVPVATSPKLAESMPKPVEHARAMAAAAVKVRRDAFVRS